HGVDLIAAVGKAEDDDLAEARAVRGDEEAHGVSVARLRRSSAPRVAGEPEREHGTHGDGPSGVVEQGVGDAAGADHGVAPVVEIDQLRQQLRAHPVAVAGDPVDDEPLGRRVPRPSLGPVDLVPAAVGGAGHQATLRPVAARGWGWLQWRWCWWSCHSSLKVRSELNSWPIAPSGWRQAPRPAICSAQRARRARAARSRRPSAIRAAASAIARSPKTHGPHWAALWPAIQPMIRAVAR